MKKFIGFAVAVAAVVGAFMAYRSVATLFDEEGYDLFAADIDDLE